MYYSTVRNYINELKVMISVASRAGQRMEDLQKSKGAEIARLQALLRKAEMRVTSLERAVEAKVSS